MRMSLLREEGWEDTEHKRVGYKRAPESETDDEDERVEHRRMLKVSHTRIKKNPGAWPGLFV